MMTKNLSHDLLLESSTVLSELYEWLQEQNYLPADFTWSVKEIVRESSRYYITWQGSHADTTTLFDGRFVHTFSARLVYTDIEVARLRRKEYAYCRVEFDDAEILS